MADVLLVSYAGYPYTLSSFCPDNGLALLAAVLREAGHEPHILDFGTVDVMQRLYPQELARSAAPLVQELWQAGAAPSPGLLAELTALNDTLEHHQMQETRRIAEETAALVRDLSPALVGFKVWNGDGYSGSVTIARAIRQAAPDIPLIAGGPHATWLGSVVFEDTDAFDAVVLGEAEDKIVPLVERAQSGAPLGEIPGVVCSAADAQVRPTYDVSLDDLPQALYDETVYPAMRGDQKVRLAVLDDSRGCPYQCNFCTHPYECGTRPRLRAAQRIVDDMEFTQRAYGIHSFRFAGSSTPGRLMSEVADEILARGLQVRYASFAHFASTNESDLQEHFAKLKRSGMYAIFFGLETGSQDLMERAGGKVSKLRNVRATIEAAKAAGIFTVCSMIVPLPFETEETFQESVRLVLEVRPDSVPVQFPGLIPHTPWFNEPERFGFEVDRDSYVRGGLDYKIKLLFPPAFWKPLPYRLNGMDFRQFTALTGRFVQTLEQNGILTGVPDDNALMAHFAGMSAREFRDRSRAWCTVGDVGAVGEFIRRHNEYRPG